MSLKTWLEEARATCLLLLSQISTLLSPWRSAACDLFHRSPSSRPQDASVAKATVGMILISSLHSAIPVGLRGTGAVGRIRLVFSPQTFLDLSPWRLEDFTPVHPAICPGEAFLAGDFCVPVMGSPIPLLIFPGPQTTCRGS